MTAFERVKFRLFFMPCCGFQLCWVNPRNPTYCPECGMIVPQPAGQYVMFTDEDAELRLEVSVFEGREV